MTYKKLLETMDYTLAVLIAVLAIVGSFGAFEQSRLAVGQTLFQVGLGVFAVCFVWHKCLFRSLLAPRHKARLTVAARRDDPRRAARQGDPAPVVHFTITPASGEPNPFYAA